MGDIAIYREAGAGDAITTATFNHNWDTVVRADSATYSLAPNASDVLCKAGRYLVLYSSRFDRTGGSNRTIVQSQVRVAGADLIRGVTKELMKEGKTV